MPNLRHFKNTFVFSDEKPTKKEMALKRHRNIKVSGDIAFRAFEIGDALEQPAPIFYITANTYSQFETATWSDYDPVFCLAPASSFYVKLLEPFRTSAFDSTTMTAGLVSISGFYAVTAAPGEWIISELLTAEGKTIGTETIAVLTSDMAWQPADSDTGYTPFSICDSLVVNGHPTERSDVQKVARNLVSFLYLVNSNAVSIIPRPVAETSNRAQRRQLLRKPDPKSYDVQVLLQLPIEDLFADVHAGRRLGPQIAGAKRTELVHGKFPISYVRSSDRYSQLEGMLKTEQID